MMLQIGDKAIDFELLDDQGETVRLSDLKGKRIVLYFYPKDNTPGCTQEACSIRDHFQDFGEKGSVVLGISKDSVKSHAHFRAKHQLPFRLLSDPEGRVVEAYGAWGEKKMMGRTYMGILRISYIIDEHLRVAERFDQVKPALHGQELLERL